MHPSSESQDGQQTVWDEGSKPKTSSNSTGTHGRSQKCLLCCLQGNSDQRCTDRCTLCSFDREWLRTSRLSTALALTHPAHRRGPTGRSRIPHSK
eukprot:3463608-Prymnesium_polylepis.3